MRRREKTRDHSVMACFLVVALVVFLGLGYVGEFAIASVGGDVHVVGGNQGWDAASDVAAWAMGRSFRVGDNICKPNFCFFSILSFLLVLFNYRVIFLFLLKKREKESSVETCLQFVRNLGWLLRLLEG